ncbi:hypothetical protein [Streptomyces sp. HD]|uniref:hypothetical protein n=1 Tax=Streptomyces sp. HD TaxID=3020892 RepID=UPI00232CB9AE|nr:hypothetical protein [Streptomyces sp. HD]MDC0765936.1 hypothetical protein [Streptomyces sp. HD]
MADEQYRWLDRETAERLLSGESLEAVGAAHRDEAEQLAKTLEALTAEPAPSSAELPGEAAALAAFRAARANHDDVATTAGHRSGSPALDAADVGLVRIGAPGRAARRPRWGRPLRLGLAAALAVGMVGGVAVAAGTGVLRTPFGGDEPGRPAGTASAAVPPDRPLLSPTPEIGRRDVPTPDGTDKAPTGPGSSQDAAPGGEAKDRGAAGEDQDGPSVGWRKAVPACRDVRDGKDLSRDRRRALESAAGSSARVWKYCKGVLTGAGESTRAQGGQDQGQDDEQGKGKGDDDQDDGKGRGKGSDDGRVIGKGLKGIGIGHHTVRAARTPSTGPRLLPGHVQLRTPLVPKPSYSAL